MTARVPPRRGAYRLPLPEVFDKLTSTDRSERILTERIGVRADARAYVDIMEATAYLLGDAPFATIPAADTVANALTAQVAALRKLIDGSYNADHDPPA